MDKFSCWLLLIFALCGQTCGQGKIKLALRRFKNTFCTTTGVTCNYKFEFCYNPLNSAGTDCTNQQNTRSVFDNKKGTSFDFADSKTTELDFTTWPKENGVQLRVVIYDVKDTKNPVYLAHMNYNLIRSTPLPSAVDTKQQESLESGGYKLTFVLSVSCIADYYGDCSVRCVAGDSCGGHYTCNKTTGARECLTGWTGPQCTKLMPNYDFCPADGSGGLDLIFLLDSSGSVKAENWNKMLDFVVNLTRELGISEDGTRVGVITFGNKATLHIKLNQYFDISQFENHVKSRIPFLDANTNTTGAIHVAQFEGYQIANGHRVDGRKVAILITDGAATYDVDKLPNAAAAFQNSGVEVYVIAVTDKVNNSQINMIASDPDSAHVFNLSNFGMFQTILRDLVNKTSTSGSVTSALTTAAPPTGIEGTWIGSFLCGKATYTFTLTITKAEGASIKGVIAYRTGGQEAKARLTGLFVSNQFNLAPEGWIKQINGWRMPSLISSTLTDRDQIIKGNVTNLDTCIYTATRYTAPKNESGFCKNGGTCFKSGKEYICCCPEGFEGKTCENMTNPCAADPCQGRGSCAQTNTTDGYQCSCMSGYAGKTCQFVISNVTCVDKPCMNNGTCTNHSISGYVCNCTGGYSGETCETPPCPEHYYGGKCNTFCKPENSCAGHYSCNSMTGDKICLPGYGGTDCKVPNVTPPLSDCPDSQVCQNNGTCFNGTCCCEPGFKGSNCGEEILECLSNPCKNGARCEDKINGYQCKCTKGFKGTNCEQLAVNCTADPCKNNATCQSTGPESFNCTCLPGYAGQQCDITVDACLNKPCKNNAICNSTGPNQFNCTCAQGFEGDTCEVKNPCLSNPCLNRGNCSVANTTSGFTCDCKAGFAGENCQFMVSNVSCSDNPCQNNASCSNHSINGFECNCTDGFRGIQCEKPPCAEYYHGENCSVFCRPENSCAGHYECNTTTGEKMCLNGYSGDSCKMQNKTPPLSDCPDSQVCQNNGTCFNGTCCCEPGYKGRHCDEEILECLSNPCKNGARCIEMVAKYKCECAAGFKGDNCEILAVNCTADPCKNNASCISLGPEDFMCNCSKGYSGRMCETVIDPCLSMPCKNGANCSSSGTPQYTCSCAEGYMGINCASEIPTTTQLPTTTMLITTTEEPCVAQDTCSGHYSCNNVTGSKVCSEFWTGSNCETRIYVGTETVDPECPDVISSCRFGGSCFKKSCCCLSGFEGAFCEKDINECLQTPCKNGGTCRNYKGYYECECKAGFSGKNCETNLLDDCANGVCLNGANCTNLNGTNNYECACVPGYTGLRCESNINECASNPCKNGATCVDGVNMYNCSCAEGFTGENCENQISTNQQITTEQGTFTTDSMVDSTFNTNEPTTVEPTTEKSAGLAFSTSDSTLVESSSHGSTMGDFTTLDPRMEESTDTLSTDMETTTTELTTLDMTTETPIQSTVMSVDTTTDIAETTRVEETTYEDFPSTSDDMTTPPGHPPSSEETTFFSTCPPGYVGTNCDQFISTTAESTTLVPKVDSTVESTTVQITTSERTTVESITKEQTATEPMTSEIPTETATIDTASRSMIRETTTDVESTQFVDTTTVETPTEDATTEQSSVTDVTTAESTRVELTTEATAVVSTTDISSSTEVATESQCPPGFRGNNCNETDLSTIDYMTTVPTTESEDELTTESATIKPTTESTSIETTTKSIMAEATTESGAVESTNPATTEEAITQSTTFEATTLEPTTESTMVEPTTESTTIEPTTESTTVEPTTGSTTIEPTTESIAVEPTTESTTVAPTTESTTVEPTTESTTVQPTTESTTVEPTTESTTSQPTTESTTIEPTTELIAVEQTTESTIVEPTTISTTVEPTTESTTVEPTTESTTVQPTTESTTVKPTTESTTVEPTTESTTVQPTTESITVEPTTESTTVKPTTESTMIEPTTESTTVEPTTESTTVEPTTESTTVQLTTESTTVEPTTESTTVESTTESTTVEPTTQSTTVESTTESTTVEATTESTKSATTEQTTSSTTLEPTTESTTVIATTESTTGQPTTQSTAEPTTTATTLEPTTESTTTTTTEVPTTTTPSVKTRVERLVLRLRDPNLTTDELVDIINRLHALGVSRRKRDTSGSFSINITSIEEAFNSLGEEITEIIYTITWEDASFNISSYIAPSEEAVIRAFNGTAELYNGTDVHLLKNSFGLYYKGMQTIRKTEYANVSTILKEIIVKSNSKFASIDVKVVRSEEYIGDDGSEITRLFYFVLRSDGVEYTTSDIPSLDSSEVVTRLSAAGFTIRLYTGTLRVRIKYTHSVYIKGYLYDSDVDLFQFSIFKSWQMTSHSSELKEAKILRREKYISRAGSVLTRIYYAAEAIDGRFIRIRVGHTMKFSHPTTDHLITNIDVKKISGDGKYTLVTDVSGARAYRESFSLFVKNTVLRSQLASFQLRITQAWKTISSTEIDTSSATFKVWAAVSEEQITSERTFISKVVYFVEYENRVIDARLVPIKPSTAEFEAKMVNFRLPNGQLYVLFTASTTKETVVSIEEHFSVYVNEAVLNVDISKFETALTETIRQSNIAYRTKKVVIKIRMSEEYVAIKGERVTRLFYLLIVDESTVSATVAYSRRADTTVLKTKLTFKKTTTDEEYTVYSKDIKILQRYSNMGLLAVTERVASMDLIKFTNKLVLAWKQHVQAFQSDSTFTIDIRRVEEYKTLTGDTVWGMGYFCFSKGEVINPVSVTMVSDILLQNFIVINQPRGKQYELVLRIETLRRLSSLFRLPLANKVASSDMSLFSSSILAAWKTNRTDLNIKEDIDSSIFSVDEYVKENGKSVFNIIYSISYANGQIDAAVDISVDVDIIQDYINFTNPRGDKYEVDVVRQIDLRPDAALFSLILTRPVSDATKQQVIDALKTAWENTIKKSGNAVTSIKVEINREKEYINENGDIVYGLGYFVELDGATVYPSVLPALDGLTLPTPQGAPYTIVKSTDTIYKYDERFELNLAGPVVDVDLLKFKSVLNKMTSSKGLGTVVMVKQERKIDANGESYWSLAYFVKKNDIILDARIEKAIDINDVRSQIDFEGPRGKYEILDNVIDPSRRYVNSFRLAVQGQVSVEDNTKFEKALKEAWLSVRTDLTEADLKITVAQQEEIISSSGNINTALVYFMDVKGVEVNPLTLPGINIDTVAKKVAFKSLRDEEYRLITITKEDKRYKAKFSLLTTRSIMQEDIGQIKENLVKLWKTKKTSFSTKFSLDIVGQSDLISDNGIDVTELSYFITFDGNVVDSMTIADLTMTEIKQVLNITIKSTTKMYSEYIFSTANRTLTRFDELFFVTLKTKVFQADITAIQNMMKAAWVKRDKKYESTEINIMTQDLGITELGDIVINLVYKVAIDERTIRRVDVRKFASSSFAAIESITNEKGVKYVLVKTTRVRRYKKAAIVYMSRWVSRENMQLLSASITQSWRELSADYSTVEIKMAAQERYISATGMSIFKILYFAKTDMSELDGSTVTVNLTNVANKVSLFTATGKAVTVVTGPSVIDTSLTFRYHFKLDIVSNVISSMKIAEFQQKLQILWRTKISDVTVEVRTQDASIGENNMDVSSLIYFVAVERMFLNPSITANEPSLADLKAAVQIASPSKLMYAIYEQKILGLYERQYSVFIKEKIDTKQMVSFKSVLEKSWSSITDGTVDISVTKLEANIGLYGLFMTKVMYASLVNDKLTFPDDSLGPNATLLQTKIQNNFSELSVYTAKTNSRLDKNFNIDIIGDVTKENTTSLTNQLKSQWINVAGSSVTSSLKITLSAREYRMSLNEIPLSRIYYMVNPTGGDSVRLPWQNPVPNSFNIGSQFKATSISQRSVFITGKIKMTLKTSVITSLKLAWEKTITTGGLVEIKYIRKEAYVTKSWKRVSKFVYTLSVDGKESLINLPSKSDLGIALMDIGTYLRVCSCRARRAYRLYLRGQSAQVNVPKVQDAIRKAWMQLNAGIVSAELSVTVSKTRLLRKRATDSEVSTFSDENNKPLTKVTYTASVAGSEPDTLFFTAPDDALINRYLDDTPACQCVPRICKTFMVKGYVNDDKKAVVMKAIKDAYFATNPDISDIDVTITDVDNTNTDPDNRPVAVVSYCVSRKDGGDIDDIYNPDVELTMSFTKSKIDLYSGPIQPAQPEKVSDWVYVVVVVCIVVACVLLCLAIVKACYRHGRMDAEEEKKKANERMRSQYDEEDYIPAAHYNNPIYEKSPGSYSGSVNSRHSTYDSRRFTNLSRIELYEASVK